jgi:phosphoglucosamine mutase
MSYEGAINEHTSRILGDFSGSLDGLKIVVDCGGGAASVITPSLLSAMGATVVPLFCTPVGQFPRPSEPTDVSLSELKKKVVSTGARVGLAHDGDADRLVVVDERGHVILGDKLLLLLAQHLQVKELVTTIDASMTIDETGIRVRRTRVGDSAVSAELKKTAGEFGGEPCGAWIFPKVSYCPDGIYAAALVATIASCNVMSKMADEIPSYPLIRGSVPFSKRPGLQYLESVLLDLHPLCIDRTDGIRLGFNQGWVLVRVSGTEPKIRITVEAKSEKEASNLFDQSVDRIRRLTLR